MEEIISVLKVVRKYFTTGCVFKNVPREPGNTPMLFTKLCPIVKNGKIRFSVSFLVSVELSSQED